MSQMKRPALLTTLLLSAFLMTACSSDKGEEAAKKAADVKNAVTESAKDVVSTAKEATTEAVETATETAKEKVAEVTEAAKEKATEVVEDTKAAVAEKAEAAVAAVAPAATEAPAASGKGKEVYDSACFACHAQGLAGAPTVGDKEAWAPRIAQGDEVLYDHAINGFAGPSGTMMPPKGGRADVSDEDIKATVDYMVAESK